MGQVVVMGEVVVVFCSKHHMISSTCQITTLMCYDPTCRLLKPYGPAVKCGVPSYRDLAWVEAVKEAEKAEQLTRDDRTVLLVDMLPSDDEDEDLLMALEEEEEENGGCGCVDGSVDVCVCSTYPILSYS